MKFSKLSQLALVSVIGLAVATLLTACQLVSIDYVFVAASSGGSTTSPGQVYVYAADAFSGAIRTRVTAVDSGGTNPVALAVTSDYYNLYVANQGNNSVVHFSVQFSGELTLDDTVTLANAPVSLGVNTSNTYLYAASYNTTGTGTGAAPTLTEYGLSNGTIGSITSKQTLVVPGYPSDTIVPTAVNVLGSNNAVYVTAVDESAYNPGGSTTSNANPGWIFGYAVGSNGALTQLAGSPWQAGVKPSALTSDPTDRFVYVTDYASNQLIGYSVFSNGVLQFMINGPFKTGNEPTSVAIDPRGIFMYVTNSLDNTVSAYSIALPSGTPSTVVNSTSTAANSTDTDPVSITIESSLGRYIYTANRLGNSVSGFLLNPNTGSLTTTLATPYPTGSYPSAILAVPHGNHATQSVTP